MKASLLWYDYETWGADPRRDRAAQFAAVRTDMDLNYISEPVNLFCKPALDTVIDPVACSITGIFPSYAMKHGLSELEFAAAVHKEMIRPSTCTLGYNNIRFDDELTRFLFYRNLFDPYEREWKSGNSRWDLLDVVRMTWALRPDGIEWPEDENGRVSFRLEKLTEANGIGHESAHDAVSDVKATVEMARLIRDRNPRLYDFAFTLRRKDQVMKHIDLIRRRPFVHISGMFPVEQGCMTMMAPLAVHPANRNEIICFNLQQDPDILLELPAEEIRDRLFTASADLPEGIERIGIKSIHINKSPMLAPAKMMNQQVAERFGFDLVQLRLHADKLQNMPHLDDKLADVYARELNSWDDPDLALYAGFPAESDKALMQSFRSAGPEVMTGMSGQFTDTRLNELAFRVRARNFPAALSRQEKHRWLQRCRDVFEREDSGCQRTGAGVLQDLIALKQSRPELAELWSDIEKHLLRQEKAFLEKERN